MVDGDVAPDTIRVMPKDQFLPKAPDGTRPGLPRDASRLETMRRVKGVTLEERIALFERLSRAAAWARTATRLR